MDILIDILKALGISLGIGALLGLLLAFADKYLAVQEDPRLATILALFPNANCGGCGYAGCSGLASSIIEEGNKKISLCRPMKPDNKAKIIDYLAKTPGPDGSTITGLN